MNRPPESVKILVGCTGSVATIKISVLLTQLLSYNNLAKIEVKVVTTEKAKHFFDIEEVKSLAEVFTDDDEWSAWKQRGDPVLHIDLSKWADVLVIAPLDANTLAKVSNGLCDNMLTCIIRAWDVSKPLIFCPAMNTKMWTHPVTSRQIDALVSWGYIHVPPISKTLMCGDTGVGAMAEPKDIVDVVLRTLQLVK